MKIHRLILPTPLQGGPANVYLVEDGDLTLVDTGPKSNEAWCELEQGFRRLGKRLSDVDKIVVTHGHTDHGGLAASIKRMSGAKVYAHPLTASWLKDPDRDLHDLFYVRVPAFLRRMGTPEEVITRYYPGAELLRTMTEPVSVDETLEEGGTLHTGGCDWEVLHTPGHATSAICLYNRETRLMFCGDDLLLNAPSNPLIELPASRGEDRPHMLSVYLRTLRRLSGMEVSVCFPGHGETILNHRAVIQQRFKRHEKRKDLILKTLRAGPKTAYEIACAVVSSLDGFDSFLGISDIVGHLDVLEEEGKVRQMETDSIVYYGIA